MLLSAAAGASFTILRILSVWYWSVYLETDVTESFPLELLLTVLADGILASICVMSIAWALRDRSGISYEGIASALTNYSVGALAVLVVAAIVPAHFDGLRITNLVTTIAVHIIAVASFAIAIGLATFLVKTLLLRRHQRTKLYLLLQAVILVGMWVTSALQEGTPTLRAVPSVLLLIGIVIMLMNVKRLNWLSVVPFDKKVRLLWLSLCAVFASAVLFGIFTWSEASMLSRSASSFIRSGSVVLGAINLYGFLYFIRLFFAIIGALPNSGIVDRRSSEVASLSHIMRLLTESGSVDHLLKSITDYGLKICGAHGAWTELNEAGSVRIACAELVHPDYIDLLHNSPSFNRCVQNSTGATYFSSMQDVDSHLGSLALRSMIVVPLIADQKRLGSLIVFSTLEHGFEDEDVTLLQAFGNMVCVALEQARLMENSLKQERLQQEALVARNIQSALLPRSSPNIEPFSIHAVMIPATEVGGDYFDYVRFSDGSWGAIIADVAGKGIPAALYMSTLKGVVLAAMRISSGPADLLCRLNETLHGSMEKRTYISLTCVQFHQERSSFTIARAGHTPAVCRVGGKPLLLKPHGVAVGLVPPAQFNALIESAEIPMNNGDICLLSTDGVTERRNPAREEIGVETLLEMVRTLKPRNAEELLTATLHRVDMHANGAEAHDDITIVGIVVNGTEHTGENTSNEVLQGSLS